MSRRAEFEGGQCPAACGNRIHIDDLIEKVDGAWVHVECTPSPEQFELGPREVVCPDCFLVRPCRCVE